MRNKNLKTNKRGFTLIEIMFYFAIVEGMIFVATSFALQISNVNQVSNNLHGIQTNMDFISEKISSSIQIAEYVNDSACRFDDDDGYLSLEVPIPGKTPREFYLLDGDIYISEKGSYEAQLNSDDIEFESLRFHKVTYPKAPDQIIVDAQVSSIGGDIESLDQDFSLHLSVSLRQ